MIIIHSIIFAHSVISCNPNQYEEKCDTNKIIIIGKAMIIKNQAAVLTDDSVFYYLDGIDSWSKKFMGKTVRVSGLLIEKTFKPYVSKYPEIKVIPQPPLRNGRYIKDAEWELAN